MADDPAISTQVFGPDRGDARPYIQSTGTPPQQLGTTDDTVSVAAVDTVPVTYLNRTLPYEGVVATSRAGEYLVVVGLSADRTGDTFVAPATVGVTVIGPPVDPPPYALPGATPTATPTDAPIAGALASTEPDATAGAGGGALRWLLPLAVIAALGVGVALVILRRRSAGKSHVDD